MRNPVKLLVSALGRRPSGRPLAVSLLDASGVGLATPLSIELLSSGANDPPEWVRFLAEGANKGRSGRAYTVLSANDVTKASTAWKGAIDLIVCFEHQFDRARQNGQPAPAAAWIKEFAATGPDGSPGLWARVEWLPEAAQLIRDRKYRYLSAVIEHDTTGNVLRVLRATLTNLPEMDTATALFSAQPRKDNLVNATLLALLGALGITGITTDEEAGKKLTPLVALLGAIGKQLGVDIAALSALTAEQISTTLQKPLAEKIAMLSATAKVGADATPDAIVAGIRALGVDPKDHIARSVYDDVAGRLATLTAELTAGKIADAKKAGKLTPAMEPWARTLSPEQLTDFLSTAAVIVQPGSEQERSAAIATLSADEKAEAVRLGVSEESFLKAKQAEAAAAARTATLAAG